MSRRVQTRALRVVRVAAIIVAAVLPAMLLYGCFAFAFWEPNPGQWSQADRGFVAFLGILGGVTASMLVAIFPGWDFE